MLVRFVKDYRDRAQMFRAGAGAVVDVSPEVASAAISGGFAVLVEPDPGPEEPVGNNDHEDDGA